MTMFEHRDDGPPWSTDPAAVAEAQKCLDPILHARGVPRFIIAAVRVYKGPAALSAPLSIEVKNEGGGIGRVAGEFAIRIARIIEKKPL